MRYTAEHGDDWQRKSPSAKPAGRWGTCWSWLLTGEDQLAQELEQLINLDQLPDLGALTQLLAPPKGDVSQVVVTMSTLSKAKVMALAQSTEWLERGANVLLFRPPGVGKSHLVSALGYGLIEAGRRVLFTRCSDLVQRLQTARRVLRLPQEIVKLDRFNLLILDDLSYVRRDQAETSVLFELISERYERKSLAITANTPFSQRGEVFVESAMAAVDRLLQHPTILEMNVENYRRRAAQAVQVSPASKARSTM